MLTSVFVVSWLVVETTFVSGLNFTLSKPRVVLGATGKLLMMCQVTETDVSTVYNIQIFRATICRATISGWKTMARIETGVTEIQVLDKNIVVVNGTLDNDTPLNIYLTLEMDVEKITCDDDRVYRCELSYKSNIDDNTIIVQTNVTLFIDEDDNRSNGHAVSEPNNKTDVRAGICITSVSSVTVSVTIAVSSVTVVVICVFVVIVALIKLRRKNQEANQTRVGYVPENPNYITPISDEAGDGAYTTVPDNNTDGCSSGYENQNPQRNVNEPLHEIRDEDHGSGYYNIKI